MKDFLIDYGLFIAAGALFALALVVNATENPRDKCVRQVAREHSRMFGTTTHEGLTFALEQCKKKYH